ncbi:MAG: BatA domain-containing protein [Elusimicrobia bacterium]|nr:BatA domain-containing protein [Elusimicrobiota bacterium]
MFSFLNPSVLWALPVAAAPFVIHLVLLRRARPLPFSDLTLLREAYRRSLPSSRLKQWLLLAARCLALAALVVAFARPVVHPAAAAGGAEAESAAVVFLGDASYSMGLQVRGKTRLQWAADAGFQMLGRLRARDHAAVAAFSDRLEGAGLDWAPDLPSARAALERLKPGTATTDYGAALSAAYRFLKGAKAGRKAVVLLSDGAAHGFRGAAPEAVVTALPDYDPGVLLLGLSWPEAAENAAVASLSAETAGRSAAGRPSARAARAVLTTGEEKVEARLWLTGPARQGLDASLWQKDRREDVRHVNLEPGLGAPVAFSLNPAAGSATWGKVELRPDALPADDAYYYALRTRARPRVLLVYGGSRYLDAGRGGWFWTRLFGEEGGGGLPYSLEAVEAGRWPELRLGDFRALILADFSTLPAEIAAGAERFVRAGGGLLVIPSGRGEGSSSLKGLERVLPARLGPARAQAGRSFGLRLDPEALAQGAALTQEGAAAAALTQGAAAGRRERFSWNDFDLQNVAVAGSYELEPSASSKIWLRDATGRPLLAVGGAGAGRSALWASSLDIEWTNLGLKPAFAAWADLILGHLTRYRESRQWRDVKAGSPLVRVWGEGEPAPALVRVRAPDGKRAAVRVVDRRAEYEDTRVPGVYSIEAEGAEPEPYAVNLDRSTGESDPAPASSPPWRTIGALTAAEDFLRALYGRDARGWALALVLLLLLAENLLSAPREPPSERAERSGRTAARGAVAALALIALLAPRAQGQEGDKFVWSQLRYEGTWDPYPTAYREVLQYMGSITSVLSLPERRVLSLSDPELFDSPFIVLAGRQSPPPLTDAELRRLRDYLTAGGFLWVEDVSGQRSSAFDRWVRRTLQQDVFPAAFGRRARRRPIPIGGRRLGRAHRPHLLAQRRARRVGQGRARQLSLFVLAGRRGAAAQRPQGRRQHPDVRLDGQLQERRGAPAVSAAEDEDRGDSVIGLAFDGGAAGWALAAAAVCLGLLSWRLQRRVPARLRLLRAAALALLAFAGAQPVLERLKAKLAKPRLAIVLDAGLTMGAKDGGPRTRLRRATEWLLAHRREIEERSEPVL